jgi:hypothetical protein
VGDGTKERKRQQKDKINKKEREGWKKFFLGGGGWCHTPTFCATCHLICFPSSKKKNGQRA